MAPARFAAAYVGSVWSSTPIYIVIRRQGAGVFKAACSVGWLHFQTVRSSTRANRSRMSDLGASVHGGACAPTRKKRMNYCTV